MASDTPQTERPIMASLSVQADRELLLLTDTLRMAIQQSLRSSKVVSRGDVLRLALRRLGLSYLCHLSDQPNPPKDIAQEWHELAEKVRQEGTCPDWLVPGLSVEVPPEQPAPQTAKKSRSRKDK